MVSHQQSFVDQISCEIVLMHVSKSLANILKICYDVLLHNCQLLTTLEHTSPSFQQTDIAAFHKVWREQTSGDVGNSIANLLQIC